MAINLKKYVSAFVDTMASYENVDAICREYLEMLEPFWDAEEFLPFVRSHFSRLLANPEATSELDSENLHSLGVLAGEFNAYIVFEKGLVPDVTALVWLMDLAFFPPDTVLDRGFALRGLCEYSLLCQNAEKVSVLKSASRDFLRCFPWHDFWDAALLHTVACITNKEACHLHELFEQKVKETTGFVYNVPKNTVERLEKFMPVSRKQWPPDILEAVQQSYDSFVNYAGNRLRALERLRVTSWKASGTDSEQVDE